MSRLLFLVVPVLLAIAGPASGQSAYSDTSFVAEAKSSAIKRYTEEIGVNSNIYNGSQYQEYSPQLDEHPYYVHDWTYGSVNYGGEQYDNVPLLFDVAEDQLISNYVHGNSIRLVRDKVRSFTINGNDFIRISSSQVTPGFYQLVYNGETKFLVRRQKTFYTKIDGNALRNAFDLKLDYYLLKDGNFHPARSERAFLSALGDHRTELRKFIRERRIRYGANREQAAISILRLYDQLTP